MPLLEVITESGCPCPHKMGVFVYQDQDSPDAQFGPFKLDLE